MKEAKTLQKRIKGVHIASFLPFFLASCAPSLTIYQKTYFAMDTTVDVTIHASPSSVDPTAEIGAIFSRYDALADPNNAIKDVVNVYALNHSNEPLKVSDELFELLEFSMDMKEKTGGFVSPLMGNLSNLWKDALHPKEGDPHVPSQADIQKAIEEMNATSLLFNAENKTIQRLGEGKIDLGAFAKGFALKKAKEVIEERGYSIYLVNAGTSSILLGEKDAQGNAYRVGFTDVPGIHTRLKNTAIGTSGVNPQAVEVDGVVYSHIVNPFTGDAHLDIAGVSLVGSDPAVLDALSTAFLVMGYKDHRSEIDALSEEYGLSYLFYDEKGILLNKGITLEE